MTSDTAIPDRQLWARATEGGLKAAEFGTYTTPLIRKSDTVAAVGTPLAARLMTILRNKKFPVIRAEPTHPAFADIPPEAEEYRTFSATYGEVWNARALRQLVRRADRSFVPKEDRWHEGDLVIDPFRPGVLYSARTDQEFDLLLDRHLNAVRSAFRRCSTLLVSLGGSEICEAVADGAVIPAWSEASVGSLDPERHAFRTLSVAETIADLTDAIAGLRVFNPRMAIILMVSPEQPPATATAAHIVTANAHGKAILRVAMEELATRPGVSYFPAFEIAAMFGNAALAEDGRTLAPKAINLVGAALLDACEGGSIEMTVAKRAEPAPAETVSAAPVAKVKEAPPAAEASEKRKRRRAEAAADAPEATAASPARRVVASVVDSYTNTVPAVGRGRKKVSKEPKIRKAPPARRDAEVAKASVEDPAKAKLRRERLERRTERETKKASRAKPAPVPQPAKTAKKSKPTPAPSEDIDAARAQKQKEFREGLEKRRKEWAEKQAKNRETRADSSSGRPKGAKSTTARPAKKADKKVAASAEGPAGTQRRTQRRAKTVKVAMPSADAAAPVAEAGSPKPVRGKKPAAKRRGPRAAKPSEGSA